jgi:hypothetical protein
MRKARLVTLAAVAIGIAAGALVWLGPVGLAVIAGLMITIGVLATIAARPTWRARYDPRSPGDHGERGLGLKGFPPTALGPRSPRH